MPDALAGVAMVRLRTVVELLRKGRWREVFLRIRQRVYGDSWYAILRCDLWQVSAHRQADPPLGIRAVRPDDVDTLVGTDMPGMDDEDLRHRIARRRLLASGIGTPYVGVGPEDQPVFLAWLISTADNDRLRLHSHGFFGPIGLDEVLVEAVYVPTAARRKRVMENGLVELLLQAAPATARYALAYVSTSNEASLRGFARIGFEPAALVHECWRAGYRTLKLERLNPAMGLPI